MAHGGESPIVYSKVSFYETAATGVATASGVSVTGASTAGVYVPATALTPLGSTYTDINGNFSFGNPVACSTSTDYVYAVAAGGNTGSYPGTLNADNLLLAAVGSCANLSTSTYVVINELSTIAAAYALSGFTSVTGSYVTSATSASFTVASTQNGVATLTGSTSGLVSGQPITVILRNGTAFNTSYFVASVGGGSITINAPALTTGDSLTGTYTTVTSVPTVSITSSAGNYITPSTSGATAAGLAHGFATANILIPPASATAAAVSPNNAATVLPATMLNLLGNILQSCVNSTGGAAGSSTNCGTLLTNTTAPGSATAPNNTLAAALNIAHFPANNVANLFALAPSQGAAFNPSIGSSTNLKDFSLAIAYSQYAGNTNGKTDSTTNGLLYPYSVALDGNDDVYVLNTTSAANNQSNIVAFYNDTAAKWATAVDTTTNLYPRNIAADTTGHVWFSNDYTTSHITGFSAASGTAYSTVTPSYTYANAFFFDTNSNMFIGFSYSSATTAINLREDALVSGAYAYAHFACYNAATNPCTNGGTGSGGYNYQMAEDNSNNIWISQYSTAGAAPTVLAYNSTTSTYPTNEIAASSTVTSGYGITVDHSGNAWADSATSLYKITPTKTSGVITSTTLTSAAANIGAGLRYLFTDGNNNILSVDLTNDTLVSYSSTAATPATTVLSPCITNSATTCPTASATNDGLDGPHDFAIDSSGNVWIASSYNGELIEVIGYAAPTYPLTAVQKQGLMP